MRKIQVVMLFVMLFGSVSFGVLTPHIGGTAGGTIYVKANGVVPGHVAHTPDNSPLHESYDLITPGSPNYLGYYAKFIFYDGTLHIDPTGKVGFTDTTWVGCNAAGGYGILNVEGLFTGPRVRPWKGGCTMEVNVFSGMLEVTDKFSVGIADTGNNRGIVELSGGIIKANNLSFFDFVGGDSYMDITGGELLVLNSNWSVSAMQAEIGVNILNSSGEGLQVGVKDVGGVAYTSVTLVPEPATMALLGIGGMMVIGRKRI